MNKLDDQISDQHLTAKELLSVKGICSRVIDEYNQVTKVLPKTGAKLFEPNGSWLQNKQLETCLGTRRDLIKVERVNRLSALAVAQWLPDMKKAKVTKRSGVEWNNYGNDTRGVLYLIPEEALLLLELNSIELLYDGFPLSVQQAYELLLHSPDSDCTLNEYRVFSQLARLGYRLQRFRYEKTANNEVEGIQHKKKVLVEPTNGRWMGKVSDVTPNVDVLCFDKDDEEIPMEIENVTDDTTDKMEVQIDQPVVFEDVLEQETFDKGQNHKPQTKIISEKTRVDSMELNLSSTSNSNSTDDEIIKWSSARIQRNVKLLPKRIDKKVSTSSTGTMNITKAALPSVYFNNSISKDEKRKSEMTSSQLSKKSKAEQEVIELSDDDVDDVQNIPRNMTRTEMLNCIPNIASKDYMKQVVSREYIPHSIRLQKNVYEYDSERISRITADNKRKNFQSKISCNENFNSNNHLSVEKSLVLYHNSPTQVQSIQSSRQLFNNCYWEMQQRRTYQECSRFSFDRKDYDLSRSNLSIRNCVFDSYHNHSISSSWSSFQVNVFRYIATVGHALLSSPMHGNVSDYQIMRNMRYDHQNRRYMYHNSLSGCAMRHLPKKRGISRREMTNALMSSNGNHMSQSSFTKVPANSWTELKKKWKESKTITIEDEDDKIDCNEIEFVEHTVQPLINPRNARNISDIYKNLNIIKPAQFRTVRKEKGKYKISYKVYSNTQRYKKSDPGVPMFHLVISRRTDKFLQPVDLNRLQQEDNRVSIIFAYVSDASISYIQAGLVSLPYLTNG